MACKLQRFLSSISLLGFMRETMMKDGFFYLHVDKTKHEVYTYCFCLVFYFLGKASIVTYFKQLAFVPLYVCE